MGLTSTFRRLGPGLSNYFDELEDASNRYSTRRLAYSSAGLDERCPTKSLDRLIAAWCGFRTKQADAGLRLYRRGPAPRRTAGKFKRRAAWLFGKAKRGMQPDRQGTSLTDVNRQRA